MKEEDQDVECTNGRAASMNVVHSFFNSSQGWEVMTFRCYLVRLTELNHVYGPRDMRPSGLGPRFNCHHIPRRPPPHPSPGAPDPAADTPLCRQPPFCRPVPEG